MKYKGGYKYQLAEPYAVKTPFDGHTLKLHFISLAVTGELRIEKGYAWDGPSGPAIDTKNFMRGSLVHDALYQFMRNGKLDPKRYRDRADRLLQQHCIEDGMSRIRAWWVYKSLHYFGSPAADSSNKKKIIEAP